MTEKLNNSYLREFTSDLTERFAPDRLDMSVGEWICTNTTLRGVPFSFDKFPFQRKICDDMSPQLVCKKISQVGLTEIQLRKAAAFVTRNKGVTLIFTFPTDAMKVKNSQTRLQPFIDSDRVFNLEKEAGTFQVRSTAIQQIGQSFLMLTGDNESDATSTPADAIFNDEVDLSDAKMLTLFNSRMQASLFKIRQQFSTPTYSGYGIDQAYSVSNQQEYFIKCHCCNHQQVPLFNENFIRLPGLPDSVGLLDLNQTLIDKLRINILAATLHCERCSKPLDLGKDAKREWVAGQSHRHIPGYHVRPFSVDTLPPHYILQQLLEYEKSGHMRGFFNTVLGETYDGGDTRLNDTQIRACFTGEKGWKTPSGRKNLYIGIDVGITCHLVFGEATCLDDIEILRFQPVAADNLLKFMNEFKKSYYLSKGGCDRDPYTPTANALRDLTNGCIVPMLYRGNDEINDTQDNKGYVSIDRTEHLDTLAGLVRTGAIRFSGYEDQTDTILEHLKDMVREEEPEKKAVWRKLNNNDHYFHALAFLTSAVKLHTGDYTGHKEAQPRSSVIMLPTTVKQHQTNLYFRGKRYV